MALFNEIIEAVADFIQVDPVFLDAQLLVVAASDKRRLTDLQTQIANRIKVAAVVILSGARANHSGTPGPYFDEIDIEVQVVENRNINDSGISGEEAVTRVAQIVEDFRIAETASLGLSHEFSFQGMQPVQLPAQFSHLAGWSLRFQTGGGERYTPDRVATPAVNRAGNFINGITCATPGAEIWYTADGTYPMPAIGNQPSNGTQHTGAVFGLAPGQLLRVRAFLAGYRSSALAEVTGS